MNIAAYLKPHVALATNLARQQGQGDEAARWERLFTQASTPVDFAEAADEQREALLAIAELPEPNERTSYQALAAAYKEAREIAARALKQEAAG